MTDWQAGDLALCVNARPYPDQRSDHYRRLTEGAVYKVVGVTPPGKWAYDVEPMWGYGLIIDGPRSINRDGDWWHGRFRKLRPHEPDAEDIETIRLLNGEPVEREPATVTQEARRRKAAAT